MSRWSSLPMFAAIGVWWPALHCAGSVNGCQVLYRTFATKEQDGVDLALEDRQGRVIGIEVKASATVRPQDLRGLRQLQAAVGNKFVQGLVLHDHDRITPFDEKLHAGPVSMLWQG